LDTIKSWKRTFHFKKVSPDTLETNIPGVFAGGEAATGPASAVEATAIFLQGMKKSMTYSRK